MSELYDIIVALKIKHYREGVSAAERSRWVRAKQLSEQKRQKLRQVWGVSSNDILING